jgi:hypothetical protein
MYQQIFFQQNGALLHNTYVIIHALIKKFGLQ